MSAADEYAREFATELAHLLNGGGEGALNDAYELGRKARADGLGILDVIAFHHDATLQVLRERNGTLEPAAVLRNASSLLNEALSPFEMSFKCIDCGVAFWFENASWSTGGMAEWHLSSCSREDASHVCRAPGPSYGRRG